MSGDFGTTKISQKWGFGMAPIKPDVQASRIASAASVKELLIRGQSNGISTAEDLSVVKGLFNQSFKQDQWDWFTVWVQLGRPSRPRAKSISDNLLVLRRQLLNESNVDNSETMAILIKSGIIHFLDLYISGQPSSLSTDSGYGYIYILSTREARSLLKIGYTNRNVEDRVKEINSATGVLVPYGVRGLWIVKDAPAVERDVHFALADYRVREDREFFSLEFDQAKSVISKLIRERRISELN